MARFKNRKAFDIRSFLDIQPPDCSHLSSARRPRRLSVKTSGAGFKLTANQLTPSHMRCSIIWSHKLAEGPNACAAAFSASWTADSCPRQVKLGEWEGAGWGSCDSAVTHHVSMRGVRCPRDQHGTTTELPWPVPRHVLRGYHPASQSDSERQSLATPRRPRARARTRRCARVGARGGGLDVHGAAATRPAAASRVSQAHIQTALFESNRIRAF